MNTTTRETRSATSVTSKAILLANVQRNPLYVKLDSDEAEVAKYTAERDGDRKDTLKDKTGDGKKHDRKDEKKDRFDDGPVI